MKLELISLTEFTYVQKGQLRIKGCQMALMIKGVWESILQQNLKPVPLLKLCTSFGELSGWFILVPACFFSSCWHLCSFVCISFSLHCKKGLLNVHLKEELVLIEKLSDCILRYLCYICKSIRSQDTVH